MTTPTDPNQQGLSPESLASQLFDAAMSQGMAQGMTDPRQAARRVVGFLTDALFYALAANKSDPVVYLTETLILFASTTCGPNEVARKELLKHIGDAISNAPALPPPGPPGGAGAASVAAVPSKP